MKKKIMLLGGNFYQMTATKAAKELGCHVISVDYIPDNPAHKYADEYFNVSTVDKEAVLALADKLKIDGIWSYASDVSAPTAAYVAEKLGLPGNSYEAVNILTHKHLMRSFLSAHGFRVPLGKGFTDFASAYEYCGSLRKPVMVKPVDSSGSKGVTKIFSDAEFKEAFDSAMKYSLSKTVIVEEFIAREGYQIAGDAFLVDGKIVFAGMMDEHFDRLCNPLVPIGESYPAALDDEKKTAARNEIQRLMTLLNMKMGAINLDFMFDKNGEVYILEIGPRNGGNLITDAIRAASGVDLAKYTILSALGMDCGGLTDVPPERFTASYVVHALEDGIYDGVWISDEIQDDILQSDMFVNEGEYVHKFDNGGFGLGAMLIQFPSVDVMNDRMDQMEKFIRVKIRQ